MIRKALLSLSLVSAGICLAAPLTPEEALNRVNTDGLPLSVQAKLTQSVLNPGILTRAANAISPAMTLASPAGLPAIYVFATPQTEGFMVVSADDVAAPLLGYSDTNTFDPDNMSPAMEDWLNQYARQIDYMRENDVTTRSEGDTRVALPSWSPIAPLLRTTWNQDAPYNNLCPKIGRVNAPTGCVATSMSQVMNYFQYPDTGQGSVSYYCQAAYQNLSLDFSKVTFDWGNMLNSYMGEYTSTQANAVAALMQAAGYSVNMTYTSNYSGAVSQLIPLALVNYFKYDESVQYVTRATKTYTEWATMIYNNLKNVGPVIYDGNTLASEGHSFVCDGYNGSGYFHFNWGWGGAGDGYFLLDSLDPAAVGIGGALGGFDYGQDAVFNIQKPKSGSEAPKGQIDLMGSLSGKLGSSNVFLSLQVTGADPCPGFRYQGRAESIRCNLGVKVSPVSDPSSAKYVACSNFQYQEMNQFSFIPITGGVPVIVGDQIANGPNPLVAFSELDLKDNVKYTITLAAQIDNGEWQPVVAYNGNYNYFNITKTGSGYDFENFKQGQFTCTNLELTSGLYYSKAAEVKASVKNETDSELTRSVIVVLVNDEKEIQFMGESYVVSLSPGESKSLDFVTPFSQQFNTSFTKATPYYLGLYDLDTNTVYYTQTNTVTMEPNPGNAIFTTEFWIENGELDTSEEYGDEENDIPVYIVEDAQDVEAAVKIDVSRGLFSSDLTIYGAHIIFDENGEGDGDYNMLFPLELKIIEAGDSYTYRTTINYTSAEPGELYALALIVGNAQYPDARVDIGFIPLTNMAGIEGLVSLDDALLFLYDRAGGQLSVKGGKKGIQAVEVYSLNGMKLSPKVNYSGDSAQLDLTTLGKGIVLVTAIDKDGNRKTKKIAL